MSKRNTVPEIIERRVRKTESCWLWAGPIRRDGYAHVALHGTQWLVHRAVYVHYKGDVPRGLELDHKCKVRHCVNPDHLEAVTPRENTYRCGLANVCVANAAKTHCNLGHSFTTWTSPSSGKTRRYCAECSKARNRAYYRRKVAHG